MSDGVAPSDRRSADAMRSLAGAPTPPAGAGRRRELDLVGVPCPLNWVRARLALEELSTGDELVLRLDPGEPRRSVPLSAREDGHEVRWDHDVLTLVKR